ncbi:MAG: hypothetical protein ACU836_12485 [Gammaproteobacteria bacterium]
MHELTEKQLFAAIHYAKSQNEHAGRAILEQFQAKQTAFAQTLFNIFPSMIADLDQNMAHLFMDLCFDIIAVFEHAFGKVPDQRIVGNGWFEEKALRLNQEMKEAHGQRKPSTSTNEADQVYQQGLVRFLHAAIDAQPSNSDAAVRLSKTMVFTTVQLFNSLYDAAASRQNQFVH